MKNEKKISPRKLDNNKLLKYEISSQSSFSCDFWRLINIKKTLEDLISYIKYLENKELKNKKVIKD